MWSGEGKSNLRDALDKVRQGKARRKNSDTGGSGIGGAEKEELNAKLSRRSGDRSEARVRLQKGSQTPSRPPKTAHDRDSVFVYKGNHLHLTGYVNLIGSFG